MSRSFPVHPVVTQNRGKGARGRETKITTNVTRGRETNITANVTRNQPSLIGEKVSSTVKVSAITKPAPGAASRRKVGETRGRASTTGMWDPNNGRDSGGEGYGGSSGRGSYGRGQGARGPRTGYRMPMPDEDPDDEGQPANNAAQPQQPVDTQDRMTRSEAYTVIRPNERKRQQILAQAESETRAYEQHRQRNKPGQLSYVGTAESGQYVSIQDARHQQMQDHAFHTSKTNRLLREQEKRQQQRNVEDEELNKKKLAARRQAEVNEQRQNERGQYTRSKNHAFLDKLEAASKSKPATTSSYAAAQAGGGGKNAGGEEARAGGVEGTGGSSRWDCRDSGARPHHFQPAARLPPPASAATRYSLSTARLPPPASAATIANPSLPQRGGRFPGHATLPERGPGLCSQVSDRKNSYSGSRFDVAVRRDFGGGDKEVESYCMDGDGAVGRDFGGEDSEVESHSMDGDDAVSRDFGGGDSEVESHSMHGDGAVSRDFGGGDSEVESHSMHNEGLLILQNMFPYYKPSLLRVFLEDCGGSLEKVVKLLSVSN